MVSRGIFSDHWCHLDNILGSYLEQLWEPRERNLYVYFGGDYLRTYERYDENAREALIEKCIKKIKEEYLIFAEDTSEEEKNVYFKQVEMTENSE